jgi:hypothetical protein
MLLVRDQSRRKSSMASIENFPRVTTETVMRDYESAAKEVEALGAELIGAAKRWEAMTADLCNTIRDTAEAYRREGEKISGRIEESAGLSEHVRKTCKDVKRRMTEGNGGIR